MPANLIKITARKKQTKVKTACMARLPGIVRPSSNTLQPDMPAAWNEKRFCKRLSPPMRKVSFQVVKGKLSAAKRQAFAGQKTIFYNALNINVLQTCTLNIKQARNRMPAAGLNH